MKKILYLTFYFEPDLSAGSFRNSPLVKELARQLEGRAVIDVVTTLPNRYSTFEPAAPEYEEHENYTIHRIPIPKHKNGMVDQVFSYKEFYLGTRKLIRGKKYDLIVASSSRFFTSYLGYRIAKRLNVPLYLDIRDIFADTMKDVLKNKLFKAGTLPTLRIVEKKVFTYATHINLISGGFREYFNKYKGPVYTTFPHGIDEIFMNIPPSAPNPGGERVITYAGNFGEGQGLHKIVPVAAKRLGHDYKFLLIGDGSAKKKLLDEIARMQVNNVEILSPVKRDKLLEIYSKSDFLFIHLNDYEAFKKVLPSKIFELAAYDKPIIAGVAGYANEFIEKHIENKILFLPTDVDDMVRQLAGYTYRNECRIAFKKDFRRTVVNKKIAETIAQYL